MFEQAAGRALHRQGVTPKPARLVGPRGRQLPILKGGRDMLALILFLILAWIVIGIIGAVVHGLIWLLIIAAVLFVATLVFGGTRLRGHRVSR
jgi:fatty acid desaturase